MSLDNVLPMSLDNSVTYVPERFIRKAKLCLQGGTRRQAMLRVVRALLLPVVSRLTAELAPKESQKAILQSFCLLI